MAKRGSANGATVDVEEGPLWGRMVDAGDCVRNGRMAATTVRVIVKRHCDSTGLDPSRFSTYSLRPGLATSAAAG